MKHGDDSQHLKFPQEPTFHKDDKTRVFLGRRHKSKSGGTVKGTFDDLSDDEKTKAFLQLLEYKLRMEKEQRTEKKEKERKENSFHELWQRLPTHQIDPVR